MMRMMLQINNPVHYNLFLLIPPEYLETRNTEIGRAVYVTEISMLLSLNRQYHSRINQRPVVQGLVNISMLVLRTQYLLLMTPPGLHTNHLISNYWSEKLICYFIFVFVILFALSPYGCEHLTKAGGMEMMDFGLQQSCYLLNIFLDLGFTLVILWKNIPVKFWPDPMLYFLSFYPKIFVILFLNILSNSLILNGTNVSGRSVILISILFRLLQKTNESRN